MKFALCGACALFAGGTVDAKPGEGKGQGKGKGGAPAHAQNKGNKGHKGNKGNPHDKDLGDLGKGVFDFEKNRFGKNDRSSILDIFSGYKDNAYGLPPGLAKNYRQGKPLPPGWQKKVGVGTVIDDSIRDFFYPVDRALFPNLKATPDTKLYMYGDRLVRVYEPKNRIIDLFQIPSVRLD